MNIVSRIAPTPNGEIHWGNLMNFVLTWVHVKKSEGQLILRFDDIDEARCNAMYAQHTKEILNYLGLDYSREYSNQIFNKDRYKSFLELIPHYTCECSRQDVFERTGDYHYDGFCRLKKLEYRKNENCVRMLASRTDLDFVLWRREDLPAYHLTSVKDDIDLGVNTVIRGEDLKESTTMQQHILKNLKTQPITFIHHRLIKNKNGDKLSKTRADGDVIQLVRMKVPVSDILKQLATLMGLEPQNYNQLKDFLNIKLSDFLV